MITFTEIIYGSFALAFLIGFYIFIRDVVEQKVFDARQIVREWKLRHTFGRHYGRAR